MKIKKNLKNQTKQKQHFKKTQKKASKGLMAQAKKIKAMSKN